MPRALPAEARERQARLEEALANLPEIQQARTKRVKKDSKVKRARQQEPRVSTTDPQARVMKMPDGGFRPAHNGQLNVDMKSRIIVGVEVSQEADARLLEPMLEQTQARYQQLMDEHYVDGGFRSNAGVTAAGS